MTYPGGRPLAVVTGAPSGIGYELAGLLPLDEGPRGYELFKTEEDGCVRAVFRPGG